MGSGEASGSPRAERAAQAEEAKTLDTIVVTGSRIARPNLEAASPVTVVTAEAIKEFGATKIEDLTNALPQVFAGQNSGVSNGADGTATIDLRGLGLHGCLEPGPGPRRACLDHELRHGAGRVELARVACALQVFEDFFVEVVELVAFGLAVLYSASALQAISANSPGHFFVLRQFTGVVVGVVIFAICAWAASWSSMMCTRPTS